MVKKIIKHKKHIKKLRVYLKKLGAFIFNFSNNAFSKIKSINIKQLRKISLVLGLFLLTVSLFLRIYQVQTLAFSTPPKETTKQTKNNTEPNYIKKIKIEKIKLSLEVVEAEIKDNTWEVSEDKANHLKTSAYPGDNGNIVVYAHNKDNMFGPIRWIDKGTQITLTTENNKTYKYKVDKYTVVNPDNIKHIQPKNTETLTLYTCTGFLDSKRYIVIAKPVH